MGGSIVKRMQDFMRENIPWEFMARFLENAKTLTESQRDQLDRFLSN
jgi:hypothetical protein